MKKEKNILNEDSLWDLNDLSIFLKIPFHTVKRMVASGEIPYAPFGKHRRFDPEEIKKLVKRKHTKSA